MCYVYNQQTAYTHLRWNKLRLILIADSSQYQVVFEAELFYVTLQLWTYLNLINCETLLQ